MKRFTPRLSVKRMLFWCYRKVRADAQCVYINTGNFRVRVHRVEDIEKLPSALIAGGFFSMTGMPSVCGENPRGA